jgi:hypothetical protein
MRVPSISGDVRVGRASQKSEMNSYSALVRTWRLLWALPPSLPGLLLCFALRVSGRPQQAYMSMYQGLPVFYAYGRTCRNLLGLYPWIEVDAVTTGYVILAKDEAALQCCLAHELVHVRQAWRWGPLFPLLYIASSFWAWFRGQDPYVDNVFERAARAAEK